jgi:hypothetical protein
VTVQWSDATVFADGTSPADLTTGRLVHVWGRLERGVLVATRIGFYGDLTPPEPGTALFETEGVASRVARIKFGDTVLGLTVNGLAFETTPNTLILERNGPLVDGTKVLVVFYKVGTYNVAVLVRTEP